MKKVFSLLIVIAASCTVQACDICGCGAGSNYIGILPEFSKRIVGIRYRYNSIVNHLAVGGTSSYLTAQEKYAATEAWLGYNISPSFRLIATIPYQFNTKENSTSKYSKNGLADISFSGFYQLINQKKTLTNQKIFIQNLWIGGGIKLPSGEYKPADKNVNSTNLFQLGTGSTDFTIQAMYDVRLQDFGINLNTLYKMNTVNKTGYLYGNKFNTSLQAYYKWRLFNALTLAPNAGFMFETNEKDKDNAQTVFLTGGSLLNVSTGVELTYKKVAAGFNWQSPLQQHLAEGSVKANNRLMLHIGFLL